MTSLPTGWALATIGDITQPVEVVDWTRWPGPDFIYVDIGSIDNSTLTIASARTLPVAEAPSRARQVVRAGDTVFSTVRTYLRNIGYVTKDLDGQIASTGFAVLRPDQTVASRFLYYYVQSSAFTRDVTAEQRGVSYPAVTNAQVRAMPIAVPPLGDQENVVATIEKEFSRIDSGEVTVESIRNRASGLVQRVIEDWLTEHQPRPVSIGTLLAAELANGRSVPDGTGYPVLRLDAIAGGNVNMSRFKTGTWGSLEGRRFRVRSGDFLVVRGNGSLSLVGRGGLVTQDAEIAYPDTLIRVRVDSARLQPEYLRLIWDCRAVRRQLEGLARTTAGIYKINQGHLRDLRIPLSERHEQQELVTLVTRVRDSVGPGLDAVQRAASRAKQLRSAVLASAFAGRLVHPETSREIATLTGEGGISSEKVAVRGSGQSGSRVSPGVAKGARR